MPVLKWYAVPEPLACVLVAACPRFPRACVLVACLTRAGQSCVYFLLGLGGPLLICRPGGGGIGVALVLRRFSVVRDLLLICFWGSVFWTPLFLFSFYHRGSRKGRGAPSRLPPPQPTQSASTNNGKTSKVPILSHLGP